MSGLDDATRQEIRKCVDEYLDPHGFRCKEPGEDKKDLDELLQRTQASFSQIGRDQVMKAFYDIGMRLVEELEKERQDMSTMQVSHRESTYWAKKSVCGLEAIAEFNIQSTQNRGGASEVLRVFLGGITVDEPSACYGKTMTTNVGGMRLKFHSPHRGPHSIYDDAAKKDALNPFTADLVASFFEGAALKYLQTREEITDTDMMLIGAGIDNLRKQEVMRGNACLERFAHELVTQHPQMALYIGPVPADEKDDSISVQQVSR